MNAARVPILRSVLGFHVDRLASLLRRRLMGALAEWAMTPEQWQILVSLVESDAEEVSQNDLARITLKDRHTISRTLDRMERDGWILRKAHSTDTRSFSLLPTAKARREFARVRSTLVTGAALYLTLVEQPARMAARSSAALAAFCAELPRVERMQPALLFVALASALAAWTTHPQTTLLGALPSLALIVPLSFGWLVPINRKLHRASAEERAAFGMMLLGRWGRLHALRSCLALLGTPLLHATGK